MTTKKRSNADATSEAVDRVRQIADAQRRIAEMLKAAATQVRKLEVAMAENCKRIETAITTERADAGAVVSAMAEHRVRTGDLCSRLVDAIERRGQRVYPAPYAPIESRWALVENHH